MRKTLTLLSTVFILGLSAQVNMNVLQPPEIAGCYEHTWADPQADAWGTPDMEDVANRVTGEMVLAYDATTMDSLACETIVNTIEVEGKIALIYRGECTFVEKALACQAAGAIGVVIISNVPDPLIQLGGSLPGVDVIIPVFLITQADGALIRASIDAGNTVEVSLGNKTGVYENDLGMWKTDIVQPAGSTPQWLATNPGDHSIPLGVFVQNFGTLDAGSSTLNAVVTQNGATLYDETVDVPSVPAAQRTFAELPDLAADGFLGDYELTYTIDFASEESTCDNVFPVKFTFGDLAAPVPLRDSTGLPTSTISIQPAAGSSDFESCIVLQDAHASRIAVAGIHLFAAKNAGSMFDEFMFGRVYRWDDAFTDINMATFASVLPVGQAVEFFVPDTGNSVQTFIPFTNPIVLEDNVRYLVCANVTNSEIFIGANENVAVDATLDQYNQPVQAYRLDAQWILGFTGNQTTTVAVKTINIEAIGIKERAIVELAAYPNPTNGIFQVPMKGFGTSMISITDAAGRVVSTHKTASELYTLDLRGEEPGVYFITVQSEKGRSVGRLVLE